MSTAAPTQQVSTNWKAIQKTLQQEKQKDSLACATPKKRIADNLPHSTTKRQRHDSTMSRRSTRGDGKTTMQQQRLSRAKSHETLTKKSPDVQYGEHKRSSTSAETRGFTRVAQENEGVSPTAIAGKLISLDCEMVGVGPEPDKDSQLARVSLVNYFGEQLYDSYVKPKVAITDYRTHVSGIRPQHMSVARPFREVQADVATFLQGRTLVGHAIKNDLRVLMLSHPKRDIRDTAAHAPFRAMAKGAPSLRRLASDLLGIEIQSGEHCSVEDARACMLLYRREKDAFESNASRRNDLQSGTMTINGKKKKMRK